MYTITTTVGVTYLGVYVDDILIVSKDMVERKRIKSVLELTYGKMKAQECADIVYRGVEILQEVGHVMLRQEGYTRELCASLKIIGEKTTPAAADILDCSVDSPPALDPVTFRTTVAKLIWLC
jgi:predicted histidine transporter YuiF (NhaC family)